MFQLRVPREFNMKNEFSWMDAQQISSMFAHHSSVGDWQRNAFPRFDTLLIWHLEALCTV